MQSGLPVGVAAFVGRERERAKVADLVADARVVTLTGSGGCGKTRLAVEVAGDVASRFSDGACWVDLQGVSEPGLVAPAIGGAVDVHERPEQALTDTLAEQLHGRHLLVVLDNCEHLVEACAELVGELSSACPQLHVLATSRVPLVVEGEATFEVAGLPVPDPDAGSASTVAAADAARLFEVRARQVAADFRIGDDNASAVAEICRRLDGIPLAIELAAARVRVLAPGQIAAGLSDRFGLLTGGVRGAPARQRTLEASLDWSYDLLDDVQRLALARLSVFAGSFELDAAEAVVGGDGIDGDDVLDLVAGLVEQSLVQVVERQGRARYRLLETIRVYARQRLSELDDPDRVRGRHLEFHVGLAGRAHAGLTGGQPEPWVARLAADLDDLRAAMDWAVETGDLRGLVDLTEPIVRFWFERGLSREVHRRLHDAAEAPGAPDDERVRGLMTAAALALAGGEPASAHRSASQAVDAARAADVGGALALGLGQRALAGVLSGLSTSEQVDADVEQAVQHAQRCEDASTHAYVLAFAGGSAASQPLDRRRVPPARAGRRGVRGQRPRLPSAGRPRGRCGVVGVVRAARPDTPSRSTCRRAQPAGRTSRVGGGRAHRAWERLPSCRAITAGRRTGCPRRRRCCGHEPWRGLYKGCGCVTGWPCRPTHPATWKPLGPRLRRSCGSAVVAAAAGTSPSVSGCWACSHTASRRHDDARAHLEASRALSTDPRLPLPLGRSLLGLAELAKEDEDLEDGVGAGP